MRIAYLILAHRYPEQLLRLVERLDYDNNYFLIHLDKKMNPNDYNKVINELSKRSNVFFLKRFTCYWAGFGIIQATIQGIKEAMEKKMSFDYLTLLSGQDYPIKTNKTIEFFFKEHEGLSFVHHIRFPKYDWPTERGGWDRVERWHFIRNKRISFPMNRKFSNRILNSTWNILNSLIPFPRKFPSQFHPYGGAQFWSLHYKHVVLLNDFIKQSPSFVNFFKFVYVPDEILIQTLVANLIANKEVVNDTLTFLEWNRPGAILDKNDLDSIKVTEYLFARKFDQTVDIEVMDIIDKELLEL